MFDPVDAAQAMTPVDGILRAPINLRGPIGRRVSQHLFDARHAWYQLALDASLELDEPYYPDRDETGAIVY